MEIPAVKRKKWTAGNLTQLTVKRIVTAGTSLIVFLMCAFSLTSDVHAQNYAEQITRTVSVTQKLPFATTYIDMPDLYRGYEKLVSEGVMGERKIEAQVVYEGGNPVGVLSIKADETGQPVNQVIQRGTKVLKSETEDGREWKVSFIRPVDECPISEGFGGYPGHTGVDFAARGGSPVYAAAEGTVVMAQWYGEYGRCVIIEHADGTRTLYGHNRQLLVTRGQKVKQGQVIARVGTTGNSTGNHLHFEIRRGNAYLDALIYINK
ncbi:peptidoglycan DD-metalloendopeptidase family protein [Oscillospiraceae bacterium PP1C4]